MKRDSWLLLHAKLVLDWTSDLGDFCNNHPSNHYDYKSRMMCVCDDISHKDFKRNFKEWLYIDDLFPEEGGEE